MSTKDEGISSNIHLTMNVEGVHLKKLHFFGKNDGYYVLRRKEANDQWKEIYQSEVFTSSQNPRWKPLHITMEELYGEDEANSPLRFYVYNHRKSSNDEEIGYFELTRNELLLDEPENSTTKSLDFPLRFDPKPKSKRGTIRIQIDVNIFPEPKNEIRVDGLSLPQDEPPPQNVFYTEDVYPGSNLQQRQHQEEEGVKLALRQMSPSITQQLPPDIKSIRELNFHLSKIPSLGGMQVMGGGGGCGQYSNQFCQQNMMMMSQQQQPMMMMMSNTQSNNLPQQGIDKKVDGNEKLESGSDDVEKV